MRFPTFLSVAMFLCVLLPSSAARAQWWLWDSPTGGNEPVDQQQLNTDTNYGLQGGHPLGQIFVPQQSQLYRIDFVGHNRYDERPVRFRLWRWNVNYATTKAGPILFEDLVVMPGPDVRQLLSVFPRAAGGAPLPVTPGAHYFFEFDAPSGSGDFAIYGSRTNMVPPTPDYYACPPPATSICDLRVNGFFQPPGDLYFRTYSTPSGAPPAPPCCTFSATSPWTPPPTADECQKTHPSDYASLVEGWVENQTPYYLINVHANIAQHAFFEAFLYRKDGSITNAQNAVSFLEKGWQCRFAPPPDADDTCPDGARVDMKWMERPAYAYLWIQDVSPSIFTAEARGRAKQLFIDSARRFWPNRERGLLNRSFTGALTYKLVSKIVIRGTDVPADEYDRWVAYADGVWNEFKTVWDTEEDALGYNYLAWSYILELAMEYGEDTTIWQRQEFKALVERYYKHMTPLGIGPSFGDTNGINVRWVTMAWLFHKASAKWDDERYKWLGDRIFDYHRTHIKPTADGASLPLWKAVYGDDRTAMVHAYFDVGSATDWTDPPESVREMPATQQDEFWGAAWRAKKIGQTFKPTDQVFAALAVKIKNRGNTTAGTIRLWKWLNTQSKTVAATNPVLYADTVSFTCPFSNPPGCPDWIDVAFEPLVHLNPADTYYFEISRNADFELAGSADRTNPYADGTIVVNTKLKGADAYFTSKTLTTDGSSVGYRRQATQRPSSRLRDSTDVNSPLYPSKYYDIGPASVPDKLVLRSGYDPGDLTFLVNVIGGFYGHAHQETAGIYAATDAGSVLLSGGAAYEDNLLQDTGVPIAKRHWGGTWQGLGNPTTIGDPAQPTLRGFGDSRKTTVAIVTWDDTFGWNLQQQRRFLFVKNRFLVVRDKTFFEGGMRASTGPIWHARDMTGDLTFVNRNWFDLFEREPQGLNGWRFYNPERYLFLYMSPRSGRELAQEFKDYPVGNPKTPGYLAYQRWSGNALTNQSVWSDSVLIPHGPESLPQDLAARISPFTLSGTGSADAWAVRVETGPGEFWYVIDNPSGGLISATIPVVLATDARYAIVREKAGVTQHYVLTYDASSLTLGTFFSKSWGARSSVEMNGNVP